MTGALEGEGVLSFRQPLSPTSTSGWWGFRKAESRSGLTNNAVVLSKSHGSSRLRMFCDSGDLRTDTVPLLPSHWCLFCQLVPSTSPGYASTSEQGTGQAGGKCPASPGCVPSLYSFPVLSGSSIPVRGQRGQAPLNSFSRPWTKWSLRKSS